LTTKLSFFDKTLGKHPSHSRNEQRPLFSGWPQVHSPHPLHKHLHLCLHPDSPLLPPQISPPQN
jgi:hypothetical protein